MIKLHCDFHQPSTVLKSNLIMVAIIITFVYPHQHIYSLEKLMLDGSNMGEEGSKAISAALLVWQRAHTSSSSSPAVASPAPTKGSDDSHVSTRPRLASLQRQPRSKRLQAADNGDVRRRSNSSGSRTSPVVDKRTGLPSHVVAAVADAGTCLLF